MSSAELHTCTTDPTATCDACTALYLATKERFGPGDQIAVVRKSHAWSWRPHVSLHGLGNTVTAQWGWWHLRVWRRAEPYDGR